ITVDPTRSRRDALPILASVMLLATGCGAVDALLAMAGRTRWNLLNVSLALAVLVGAGLLLIPRFGATGAAVALATAVAVNNLLRSEEHTSELQSRENLV